MTFANTDSWSFTQTQRDEPRANNDYTLTTTISSGSPIPSGLISGDGFVATNTLSRTIDVSNLNTTMPLFVGIDYRIISDTPVSSVTNAFIAIHDDRDRLIHSQYLIRGGIIDTNWRSFSHQITNLGLASSLTIQLTHRDNWNMDWNQKAYFDNFYIGEINPILSKGAGGASGASAPPLTVTQQLSERIGIRRV